MNSCIREDNVKWEKLNGNYTDKTWDLFNKTTVNSWYITRTFKGNWKRFKLAGVRVIKIWEQMTGNKEKTVFTVYFFSIQSTF